MDPCLLSAVSLGNAWLLAPQKAFLVMEMFFVSLPAFEQCFWNLLYCGDCWIFHSFSRTFGPPLFKHDSSHPPSSDTPESPLFLTLWANYLVARGLHYQVSMDSPNKTCGVELYSPHFAARQFGLVQGVPCPIMYTSNKKWIWRSVKLQPSPLQSRASRHCTDRCWS